MTTPSVAGCRSAVAARPAGTVRSWSPGAAGTSARARHHRYASRRTGTGPRHASGRSPATAPGPCPVTAPGSARAGHGDGRWVYLDGDTSTG
ncbi:hypothetical protein [Micromonospora zhanjiangensis]|uniref:Uncharacterized protein n=1 Tax=Micromonospora zhanjiangensis TaxID=1522057 RepID=A0ABV8KNF8_9ACTN